jgi:PAS domain S-box-containing protein
MDMLCLASVDGYFKVLNKAWSETLGYSDEELLSRPFLDLVHPDDRAATLAEVSNISDGSPAVQFRNRYRCKDGSYKWLAWRAAAATADGTIYARARDVTTDIAAESDLTPRKQEQWTRVQTAIASDAISMVFQPIVDATTLDASGYEALARFAIDPARPTNTWFEDADASGLRAQLELHAIRRAMAGAEQLPARSFLSINTSPATLATEGFRDAMSQLDSRRTVLEVTESAASEHSDALARAISPLRQEGIRLAIDDAGAGVTASEDIARLEPDFIKLDIFLIRNINAEPLKRAVVTAIVSFAAKIGAQPIAVGVETAAELATLVDLNVFMAQGFYVGRPGPLPGTRLELRATSQRRASVSTS